MTTPATTGKKILTQQEFKAELEKMTPAQAVGNIKNLISYAMTKGIIDEVNKVVTLEKALDILEQASLPVEQIPVDSPVPTGVAKGMELSNGEKEKMIN